MAVPEGADWPTWALVSTIATVISSSRCFAICMRNSRRPAGLRPAQAIHLTGGLIPVGGQAARDRPASGIVPVLLAGDAAGLTNPVTGAGIEAAVRSGELAGAAAASWLAGNRRAR